MNALLAPGSVEELVEAVRVTPRLLPVGAGTKPRMSASEAVPLSTKALRGIREYDPSEFTFTAAAGTPVREIAAALGERGQYLPFDPMLLDAGATLGGTVAAGISGPGRFRFGGLRDFILGVLFVDGTGRLLRMGGKVVKNAAGFDLPKFFVGSMGRFGVLAELTFKVFPRPASAVTLRLNAATLEEAMKIISEAGSSRFEFEALDIAPDSTALLARLAAPAEALEALTREVLGRWPGQILSEKEAESHWHDLREFRWSGAGCPLIKVPLSPVVVPAVGRFVQSLEGAQLHVSAGGNVGFLALGAGSQAARLDTRLRELALSGVALRGDVPLWSGLRPRPAIAAAVKHALDPDHRFPNLDD
jgi:glycolate oxidase FAD binding subunit